MHDFKVNDYVKWEDDDETKTGVILSIGKKTAVVKSSVWNEKIKLSDLTYLPPLKLNSKEYKALVSLAPGSVSALYNNPLGNIINSEGYTIKIDDIVAALRRILGGTFDENDCSLWGFFIDREVDAQSENESSDDFTENYVLRSVLAIILDPAGEFMFNRIPEAIDESTAFIEDRDKPFIERRYPEEFKFRLLAELEDDTKMSLASDEDVALYRRFAEELADNGGALGLRAVGYGCYGGNRAFECDWERAHDCITKLYEMTDDMPDKAIYANTLGYIYYYGRCGNGTPEYEKAYKYFSFAAFNGIYEAQYKIADMYKDGLGVVKSPETSLFILQKLYEENIKHIQNGEFDCKFADVALRLGALYADGSMWYDDHERALMYYMQADFAIRMRMSETNYYGDTKVCSAIADGLASAKEKLRYEQKNSVRYRSLFSLFENETNGSRKLDLIIKKQSDLTYKMTFSLHKYPNDPYSGKMFLTVPEIGLCGLYTKYSVIYRAKEELDDSLLDRVLTVDAIGYYQFFYDDGKALSIFGSFILKNNNKAASQKYRFASVTFGSSQLYDYLCDDMTVSVGDKVIVKSNEEEAEVTVVRISEKTESEVFLPIKKYKKIIRKA